MVSEYIIQSIKKGKVSVINLINQMIFSSPFVLFVTSKDIMYNKTNTFEKVHLPSVFFPLLLLTKILYITIHIISIHIRPLNNIQPVSRESSYMTTDHGIPEIPS